MAEFVVPYTGPNAYICDSCNTHKRIGLLVRETSGLKKAATTGFVCLECIARMWNNPEPGPMEPSAEERAMGVPVIDTSRPEEDFPDV